MYVKVLFAADHGTNVRNPAAEIVCLWQTQIPRQVSRAGLERQKRRQLLMERLSLLYPGQTRPDYRKLPEQTAHDLGLDKICCYLTEKDAERTVIYNTMIRMTDDEEIIRYRCQVFDDILHNPQIRTRLQKVLDKMDFLKNYGSFAKRTDGNGVWDLIHRLDEMKEYIECLEAITDCLSPDTIRSEGLQNLRRYAKELYEDQGFSELKKDIDALKIETGKVKSVTLGVNLNERYEPETVGICSINTRYFTKSNALSNFCDFLSRDDNLRGEASWDGNYSYKVAPTNMLEKMDEASAELDYYFFMGMLRPGVALLNKDERGGEVIRTLDKAMAAMLSSIVRKLKDVLSRHVQVSTHVISGLIPEFLYYIRWAEYVEKLQAAGFAVCRPQILPADLRETKAQGLYNLHLAQQVLESKGNLQAEEVIANPLCFDKDHRLNLLTGANRGGKTTYTQAAGLSYLLVQGGIYAPAESYAFSPVDNIFTHYPADENQTQDLGRLGEESRRFREIFMEASSRSLLLLNESFSTTSFEEGYYIATDAVKAMMQTGMRVIFNTHMHKLASDIDRFNAEAPDNKAVSLVAMSEGSERTYRIVCMAPEGFSHARDIAVKYGVTFDQLMQGKEEEIQKI